jgi:hypothetical protein
MNERIKELMGKTLDSEFSHTWDTMTYEDLLKFSENFAELIVKECVDIAYKFDEPKLSGPGMIIGNRIEEHFGVEE